MSAPTLTCSECGRPIREHPYYGERDHVIARAARLVVLHSGYGCDTGCCGHRVVAIGKNGEALASGEFDFSHPYGEPRESFIRSVAGEWSERYKVPIDFAACELVDD